MPRNVYFSQGAKSEQNLYEDITIEGLKIYGHDAYYIPRKIVNEDGIFNEDQLSEFAASYAIEAYVQNDGGYEGDGELLSKFGLEIRDQITLVIANRRWEQLIGRFLGADSNYDRKIIRRPMEGDLIYLPFVKGLFEITFVEMEEPFYQLQNLPTFQLKCELFEYGGEAIDTGFDEVDTYETQFAQRETLNLSPGTGAIGSYIIGEDVFQLIPNLSVSPNAKRKLFAEVATWDSPNLRLEVYGRTFDCPSASPNSTSFSFSTSPNINFATKGVSSPQLLTGLSSGAKYYVSSLGDQAQQFLDMKDTDSDADNSEFETIGNNFIDFSVANPFGLPDV